MAGVLPSSNYWNVVHLFEFPNLAGGEASVTYSIDDHGIAPSPGILASQLAADYDNNMLQFLDADAVHLGVEVYQGPTPSVVKGVATTNTAGLRVGASLPPNVAVLIHKRTDFIGLRNRGRMYLPYSVNENIVDEVGTIDAGVVAVLQTEVSNWLLSIEGHGYEMVITHGDGLGLIRPVVQLDADIKVATQRRRMRR